MQFSAIYRFVFEACCNGTSTDTFTWFMTGRERIESAMQGRQPDRVPVMCQLALGHYFLHAGIPAHQIWFTSEGFAEALVRLQKQYRFDGILINLPGRPPDLLDDIVHIEKDGLCEKITWKDEGQTVFPGDDSPQHIPASDTQRQRADFQQLDLRSAPELDLYPGYLWNIYHAPYLKSTRTQELEKIIPEFFLRTIDLVKLKTEGAVSVHGEVFSPFTHFMELFGYQEALMALMTDPEKAHSCLDFLTTATLSWGLAQANRGVDAVLVSSAFAGGSFISREMYREFVVPYERTLINAIRKRGTTVYTHTCGKIGDRLDLMLETGTQGVDTLDPPPLGNVNLGDAKKTLAGRAFIKGNMNAVELLSLSNRDQVQAFVLSCMKIGKPQGGYILSTACSVAPRVEPWKLEMLVPLAEEYGRYDG